MSSRGKRPRDVSNDATVAYRRLAPDERTDFVGQAIMNKKEEYDNKGMKKTNKKPKATTTSSLESPKPILHEKFDPRRDVVKKVNELVQHINKAKSCLIVTGAGVSVSAGIRPFNGRGGLYASCGDPEHPPKHLEETEPTVFHKCIADLVKKYPDKFTILSQNIDGLHEKSGVPAKNLIEVHGNVFHQRCTMGSRTCQKSDEIIQTDYCVPGGIKGKLDVTDCSCRLGNGPTTCHCCFDKCPACGSYLQDTLVHYSENLRKDHRELMQAAAKSADLCIVFGTGLTVAPVGDIPSIFKDKRGKNKGGVLAIVNLQETQHDAICDIRLFAKSDDVSTLLREKLGMTTSTKSMRSFDWSKLKIYPGRRRFTAFAALVWSFVLQVPSDDPDGFSKIVQMVRLRCPNLGTELAGEVRRAILLCNKAVSLKGRSGKPRLVEGEKKYLFPTKMPENIDFSSI